MRIANNRKQLGFTGKRFAEILRVDESTVNKWEKGVAFPRGDTIREMRPILNLTADEILDDIDAEKQKRLSATASG